MLAISSGELQHWLAMFFWPLCRIAAFLMSDPLLGHTSIPNTVKISFAVLLSVLLAPVLPPMPDVAVASWESLGIVVEQLLIGASLGMVMRVTLAAVEMAGEICGMQMGLAFASFYSAESNTNTMVLSRLLSMTTLLMFLALDGHLLVLQLLASTFQTLPIGNLRFDPSSWQMVARYGSHIFLTGLLLALPMVAALLMINLAMGILNRAAPQLTVFAVGFPVTLSTGLVLLMALTGHLGHFIGLLLNESLHFMQMLVEHMIAPT
ncbi:flagellar biosynthetic protein FliR [Pseudomonas abieticivorans]|uniref:flagellar biosynthetic protein FliR n=1 Tax=Pseudomonas abieticivorans TaxID=2931382 RepID=UPI0020BEAA58|nr:flagellar biosynthetic protein FliR [Pseudomonas sp. PIA16]